MTYHGDGAQSTSEYCALPFQHPPGCPGTAPGSTLNQRENNRQSHTEWISMRRRSVDQYGRTLTLYLRVRQRWPNAPVLLIEAAAQYPPEFSVLSPHLERANLFA